MIINPETADNEYFWNIYTKSQAFLRYYAELATHRVIWVNSLSFRFMEMRITFVSYGMILKLLVQLQFKGKFNFPPGFQDVGILKSTVQEYTP